MRSGAASVKFLLFTNWKLVQCRGRTMNTVCEGKQEKRLHTLSFVQSFTLTGITAKI